MRSEHSGPRVSRHIFRGLSSTLAIFANKFFVFFCIAVALGNAPAAFARVYWLAGKSETGGIIAADPAWTRAYATMLRINGGKGGLEVWSAHLSMDEVIESLRAKVRQNGGAIWFTGSGELAWGIGSDGENVHRFLISAGEGPRSCLVFQLSQTFDDFNVSILPPSEHLLAAAPPYPGSEEKSFLASDTTHTEMATAKAGATPSDVKNFYAQQLPAAGWSPVFQPGKGVDIYLHGNELILVSTESAGAAGGSVIILLHKPLSSAESN